MGLFNYLERKIDLAEMKNVGTITGDLEDSLYFKALAVEIATSYIANIISKCEFKVFENGDESKRTLYYLLNLSSNANESASQMKQKLIHNLIYDGEALIVPRNNMLYVADGFGIDKHPLASNVFTNIQIGNETLKGNLRAENVFYFKLHDKNIKALIDSMYEDYNQIIATACLSYKDTGASEKYKLVLDGIRAGDKQFTDEYNKVVKAQLKEFINNRKAIYPQFKGYDLQKMETGSGTTDSSDILNLRKDVFEMVAESFKMPVSLLYGNMTNVRDIINGWLTVEIEPICKMIEEEFTRKTTNAETFAKGNFVKIDTTMVQHMDIFDLSDGVNKLIACGCFCVDDLREKLGEPRLDTEFSTSYWMTKNYILAKDALKSEGGGTNEGM